MAARPPIDRVLAPGRAAWLAERILPHEPALRRWLGDRLALPAQDVDDIVQESYAKLAALDDVGHVREPAAYLYTVARSLVQQHLRRAQVVAFETVAELDALDAHAPAASPERIASSRQQLLLAQRLLGELPERCRQVFSLRRIEGLSQREIAERLRISENTVEKHMGKALRLLMSALADRDGTRAAQPSDGTTRRVERGHGRD